MAATDTWDDVLARLDWHLRNAGRTLKRPVVDVRLGEPSAINTPMIAYWYDGDEEGQIIGNTLARANYTERVKVRWYWPVGDRAVPLAAEVEREIRKANRATTRELYGDMTLGGSCAAVRFIEHSETAWIPDAWVRTLTLTLGIEMPDLDDIVVGD